MPSQFKKATGSIYQRSRLTWTKAETRDLRRAVKSGLPWDCIEIKGRSPLAIRAKAYELKLSTGTRWSKKEEKLFRHEWGKSKPLTQIIIRNPTTDEIRSINSLRVKAIRLGLKERRPARISWTQKEIRLLVELSNQDLTARQIKDEGHFGPGRSTAGGRPLPERSLNAIAKMRGRLGLGNRILAERISDSRCGMNHALSAELNQLIKRSYKTKTSQEIAEEFNAYHCLGVTARMVRARRRSMGISFPQKEASKLSGSYFKSKKCEQSRSKRVKKSWDARRKSH